ncbi:MAG: CsgG/HfaB family protein [Methanocella sp.]
MRRAFPVLTMALLLLLASVPAAQAEGDEISVAVMPFEDVKINQWWDGNWDIGDQFSVLVTDALVGKGKFKVMERTRLAEIMAEQRLQVSGAVDESTAVQLGKLLGVRLMVLGSVTEFRQSGATGLSFGQFGLGLQQASTKLSARLVDVQTGQILAASKGDGQATGASFNLRLSGVSFATSQFRSTTLGQAATKAVDLLVNDLVGKIEANAAKLQYAEAAPALSGRVVAILGPTQVIIDLGKDRGVKKGTAFQIFRLQQVPGLSAPVRVPVGALKVTSVDQAASVCSVTQTESQIQVGDVVEAQ